MKRGVQKIGKKKRGISCLGLVAAFLFCGVLASIGNSSKGTPTATPEPPRPLASSTVMIKIQVATTSPTNTPTDTPTPTPKPTVVIQATTRPRPTAQPVQVAPTAEPAANCDPSYPDFCIAPFPPDLNCPDIPSKNFRVLPPDPHRFDADGNGVGCES